jgi:hypothetical protein
MRLFQEQLYNAIANATVWPVLRERPTHYAKHPGVERCIVCTPLSAYVFVTLATQ